MQIYGGRTYFWQWDLDQRLVSDNLEIGDKVHFQNPKHCKALVCEAYEQDGVVFVDVPNILLQNSLPINVYRMKDDGDGGYHTREKVTFEVKQRARPDDYVYTETEIFSYAELEKRVEALEKREPGSGGSGDVIAPDAVLYTEQALTEEQQMQARKNLGLYYKSEEQLVVASGQHYSSIEGTDISDYLEYTVVINAVVSGFSLEYSSQRFRDYDFGFDVTNYYIGNSELYTEQSGFDADETANTEMPFVIYTKNGNTHFYVDETKLEQTDEYGVYNFIVYAQGVTETVYTPIPAEYLPGKLLPNPTPEMEGMIPQVSGGAWIPVPMPGGGEGGSAVSPTVKVTEIDGGHTVKVTDAEGEKTFDVMDGTDGYTPQKGVDYFDGEPGYTPVKGTDYFTDADKEELVADVLEQVPGSGGAILRLLASVTLEENSNSVEFTGLNSTAGAFSIRIYNPGSTAGGGLSISINGKKISGYTGTCSGTSTRDSSVNAWIWKNDDSMRGRAVMSNLGINTYEWSTVPEVIESIAIESHYNTVDETKYYSAGTVVELYEGVYPNVK